jgi:hypothetical protein
MPIGRPRCRRWRLDQVEKQIHHRTWRPTDAPRPAICLTWTAHWNCPVADASGACADKTPAS